MYPEMTKKLKPIKPLRVLSLDQVGALRENLNSIGKYLVINNNEIDKYESAIDSKILRDFKIKISTKIMFCTDKNKCMTIKSIKFFERYLYSKYAEKCVIQTTHPLCSALHSKLVPVLQQEFL